MRDIDKLKYIALEEKINEELKVALDISDPVVTEYVIHECIHSNDEEDFILKMNQADEVFTTEICSNIYFMVKSIFGNNLNFDDKPTFFEPNEVNQEILEQVDELNEQQDAEHKFPGLALKNNKTNELHQDELGFRDLMTKEKSKKNRDRSLSSDGETNKKRKANKKSKYELKVNDIYYCKILKVYDYGLLVRIRLKDRDEKGLVHISNVSNTRISNLSDLYKENQKIFCKLISIKDGKVALSTKSIDQTIGEEISTKKLNDNGKLKRRSKTIRRVS